MEATAQQVDVQLGDRSYSIHIEAGLIKRLNGSLTKHLAGEHVIVVSDSTVASLYAEQVLTQIATLASRCDQLIVPAGEASKSVSVCDSLWQQMVGFSTDRQSIVVALGGGVVGDLAGFLAATFGRGLRFVQIPTTLLSQVDSSVGGKVGINLPQAKNMVGAFLQPKVVVIDPTVLDTLTDRDYRAGLAEVIKYGVIMDRELFEFLESAVEPLNARDHGVLAKIVAWCCRCKAEVVAADEREVSGRRAILNYGHTYGHAIESVYGYGEYLHGEAISIGMTCAARMARLLGLVDQAVIDRQTKLFHAVGLPTRCPHDRCDALVEAMKHDKKVSRGKLKLILPKKIGEVVSVPAPSDNQLRASLLED